MADNLAGLGWADHTAEEAAAWYRVHGDPADTLKCFSCGHTVWAHHRSEVGEGCVATQAPVAALDQVLADQPTHPAVLGSAGCLCPGFVQGRYPYAIRKHLDGVGEGDCVGCGHGLDEHSSEYGCLCCPCGVGADRAASGS